MTDNEIIKALVCCSNSCDDGFAKCDECPRFEEGSGCTLRTMKDAFDLINRQKAEIERLLKIIADKEDSCMGLATQLKITNELLKTAKSEAIKEFAEELEYFVLNEDIEVAEPKCKDYESYINGANQFRHQIKNGINRLVKEGQRQKQIRERKMRGNENSI